VREGRGARIALRGAGLAWSYADLKDRVDRIVELIRMRWGLVTGSRILLRGANHPMLAACWLAVVKAGCIAVNTMPLLRTRELAIIARKAGVQAALVQSDLLASWQEALCAIKSDAPCLDYDLNGNGPLHDAMSKPRDGDSAAGIAEREGHGAVQSDAYTAAAGIAEREGHEAARDHRCEAADTAQDDVALIAFTSGTSGTPKATLHFQRDLLLIADVSAQQLLKPASADVFIGTPPLAFTFGLGGLLIFPLRAGATAVLQPSWTPESLLEGIREHRASICFTAPTFYRRMARAARAEQLGSLRACVSSGERLPADTRAQWYRASGIDLTECIGSTEMLHAFIGCAPADARPGTLGKVIPGFEACILDAEGRAVAPGMVGALAIRGPTGCRYLDDTRQTESVRHGWNLTGDACSMSADGHFSYHSRADDMIIASGYNIAGPEVEEVLLAHPAVAECGVVGAPDPERGQIVTTFVVLSPDSVSQEPAVLAEALKDWVRQQLAPYKAPRRIHFVKSLPRTENLKLQRFRLREWANDLQGFTP
jgi:2-aminobenzoate-CoA ligase